MNRYWGWRIFENIILYCKTNAGFSGIKNVTLYNSEKDDIQQAYFLSETLKYLYLLMSNISFFSLDEYVFNTEAHPFKIFK